MPSPGGPTAFPSAPVLFVTDFPTTQWATASSMPPASFPTPETQVVVTPSPNAGTNAQASPTFRPTAPVIPPTPQPTTLPPTFSPTVNPTTRPATPTPSLFPTQSPYPTTGQPINANAANSNGNSNSSGGGALPVGALVGIVVGCLLLAGVVLYFLFVKNGEGGRRMPEGSDLHNFYGGGERHSGGGIDMHAPGFTPYLNEPPRRNSRGSRGSFGAPPAKRDSIPGLSAEDARRSSLTRGQGPHSFEGGMPRDPRDSIGGTPRRPSYSAGNRLSTETRQSLEQIKPRGLSFTGRDSFGGAQQPRRESFSAPQGKRPSYAL